MQTIAPPTLTPRQVAAMLGVSVSAVHKWITSGALPASRVGRRWRIAPEDARAMWTPPVRSAS